MIGMIGFGRFGGLMAKYLARDYRVYIYNRSDKSESIRQIGGIPADLKTACAQRVVVLCVPISTLKTILKSIAPLLRPDALVADVCSVKVYPVQWMKELLPDTVSILPTHPMFGPDSAANSLLDRKIVLCPGHVHPRLFDRIRKYLAAKGLNVIEASPEEHDRQIAVTLSLTHFIGRSLEAFGAKEQIIDTEGYKRLIHILDVVTHDTWQLFEDMNAYNPYARENRKAFLEAAHRIEERIKD